MSYNNTLYNKKRDRVKKKILDNLNFINSQKLIISSNIE